MKKTLSWMNWVAVGVLGTVGTALAYEPSTHTTLTALAFDRSRLSDPSLLTDLGFNPSGTYREITVDGVPVTGGVRLPREVVAYGAAAEDYHTAGLCPSDWTRPFNHFFDPQHGGRALEWGGVLGHPSPDWALEDNGQVTTRYVSCLAAGGRPQNFSYRDAQANLYAALIQPNPTDRDNSMGMVLQTLGHVVHHVQDMAQPAHTRNEAHSPINPPERAWIEAYTEGYARVNIASIVNNNPYPVPSFARARDYWVTSGAGSPMYVGMAEYTSQNFVSQSTGFQSNGSTVLANPEFPLPNGQGKTIETRTVTIRLRDTNTLTGPMQVVTGPIYDGYAFGSQPNRVLATQSLVDRMLQNSGFSMLFGVNSYVYEQQYPVLLPRAVSFSAGLINHFFAGKLSVSRAASGPGWVIRNEAAETMSGQFELYYQTTTGQRFPVSGGTWGGTVAAGQSTPALAEPPNTASKVVAVFVGTIGSESMLRTAGRVTDYSAPPVPCGQALSAGGSSEGFNQLMEMGSEAGPVQIEFEAYQIPDKFEIRAENSAQTLVVTTTNMVSGWRNWTYQFNPASLGTSKFRIRVTGNTDPATLWTASVSCPNKTLTNSDRIQDRISITFGVGATSGAGCNTGYTSITVNGTPAGTLHFSPGVGDTSSPVTVTAGTHQQVVLQTTITTWGTPGFTCSGNGSVFWNDRAGRHYLSGGTSWISIQ
ncbi:phospholipase C/P1 nuclease family protein [Peristeroidobacter soli]|uniref:hypothetical protein n=1 Tax=Peristeroidobacter soli TaxID=2497877 RepID=UPI00101D5771|nr:hypothetical protein [Peristeroidobacter soli]